MGGIGSGRSSRRMTTDDCRSLDINYLHRNGCLEPGRSGSLSWSRDGAAAASISLQATTDCLHLSYRIQGLGGEGEDVEESVRIVRTSCRYGGSRPYFICPGVVAGTVCGRRVAKLYGGGRYFLCRHCYRLSYASQREDELARANRRANKRMRRLGRGFSRTLTREFRPKGMWRQTWERRRAQVIEAEIQADEAFAACALHLLNRSGQHQQPRGFWS